MTTSGRLEAAEGDVSHLPSLAKLPAHRVHGDPRCDCGARRPRNPGAWGRDGVNSLMRVDCPSDALPESGRVVPTESCGKSVT